MSIEFDGRLHKKLIHKGFRAIVCVYKEDKIHLTPVKEPIAVEASDFLGFMQYDILDDLVEYLANQPLTYEVVIDEEFFGE
jgi:hypothetical protein